MDFNPRLLLTFSFCTRRSFSEVGWLLTAYAKASAVNGSTNSKQTLNGLFIFTFTN